MVAFWQFLLLIPTFCWLACRAFGGAPEAQQNPAALQFGADSLRDDPDFVLKATTTPGPAPTSLGAEGLGDARMTERPADLPTQPPTPHRKKKKTGRRKPKRSQKPAQATPKYGFENVIWDMLEDHAVPLGYRWDALDALERELARGGEELLLSRLRTLALVHAQRSHEL